MNCELNHFCRCDGSCRPRPDPLAWLDKIIAEQGVTPATILCGLPEVTEADEVRWVEEEAAARAKLLPTG